MQVLSNIQRAVATLLLVVYAAFVLLWSTHVWLFHHHHHPDIAERHFDAQTPTWEGGGYDIGEDHHCGLCHWLVQADAPPPLFGADCTVSTPCWTPAPRWHSTPIFGAGVRACVLLRGPPSNCFF
jgi:hypothetical protein